MSLQKTTVINEGERLTMTLDFAQPTQQVLEKILEIIGGTTPDEYILSTAGKPLDYSKPLQQQATAFNELTLKKKGKGGGIFRRSVFAAQPITTTSPEQSTKIFGTPLEEYVDHGKYNGLPIVMYETIEWILANGITEEGLFRTAGNQNEILNLKKFYDQGKTGVLSTAVSPHVVAGLLKSFLKEMPEPLLTFELYQVFIKIARTVPELELCMMYHKVLITALPEPHRVLLFKLLEFLFQLVCEEANNGATLDFVTTAFAAMILRPTDDCTVEMIQDADVVNEIVSLFIENFEYLIEEAEHDFISVGKANFDYEGTTESELTFENEDIIFVVKEDNTGWWEGEVNGLYGFFPSNYAEIICPLPVPGELTPQQSNDEIESPDEAEQPEIQEKPTETESPAEETQTESPKASAPVVATTDNPIDSNPVSIPATVVAAKSIRQAVNRPESTIGGTSKKEFMQQMTDVKESLKQSAEVRARLETLVHSLSDTLRSLRQSGNNSTSSGSGEPSQENKLRSEVQEVQNEISKLTNENQSLHARIKETQNEVSSVQKKIQQKRTENENLTNEIKETQNSVSALAAAARKPGPSSKPIVAVEGKTSSGTPQISGQPPAKRRVPPSRASVSSSSPSASGAATKPVARPISRAATSATLPNKPAPKLTTNSSLSKLPPVKPSTSLASIPDKPGAPSTRPASTRPSRFSKPKPPGSGAPRLITGTGGT